MKKEVALINHFPINKAIAKYTEELAELDCLDFKVINIDFTPKDKRVFPKGTIYKGTSFISFNVAFRNIVYRSAIKEIRETASSGGIIHYTDQSSPAFYERSEREVVTFHDLFPLSGIDSHNFLDAAIYKRWTLKFFSFKNAIAVSNFTKKSLIEAGYKGNVFVVHHSVRKAFYPMSNKSILRKKYNIPLDKTVIISNSTDFPRKNLAFQGLAVDSLGDSYVLIRIGPPVGNKSMTFRNISDEVLSELYNLSDCFILTSTHEGFNYPVVEAMSCGLPVVVPDIPVMREVADNAGIFFELGDIKSFQEAIKNAVSNYELNSNRSIKRSKFFSRDKFNQEMCNVYSKIK